MFKCMVISKVGIQICNHCFQDCGIFLWKLYHTLWIHIDGRVYVASLEQKMSYLLCCQVSAPMTYGYAKCNEEKVQKWAWQEELGEIMGCFRTVASSGFLGEQIFTTWRQKKNQCNSRIFVKNCTKVVSFQGIFSLLFPQIAVSR
jgi:hypothetical protein